VALGELARNIVHRMTVYVCLHNPEHVHVGGRACPFAVGSQGSLDRAGWADALDGELTRTAAQLEEKCMQLNQTQARVVEGIAELDYWDRRIIIGDAVVCDGKCYSIGHEGGSRTWRGYGGARWLIRFADGRELCTSNLWHNGTVPTTHRRALPDNATIEGIAFPRIFPESPDDVEF
jgi:hypothetical protein